MLVRSLLAGFLLVSNACGGSPGARDAEVAASPRASATDGTATPSAAAAVIDAHLVAYNQRDLDGFMSFFHDEVEIYSFPGERRTIGKAAARDTYQALFGATESLQATIEQRSEHDGMVVDTERVGFRLPGQDEQTIRALAIYRLRDGLIHRLWLIQLDE